MANCLWIVSRDLLSATKNNAAMNKKSARWIVNAHAQSVRLKFVDGFFFATIDYSRWYCEIEIVVLPSLIAYTHTFTRGESMSTLTQTHLFSREKSSSRYIRICKRWTHRWHCTRRMKLIFTEVRKGVWSMNNRAMNRARNLHSWMKADQR